MLHVRNGSKAHDTLTRAREELARIRRHADDQCRHEVAILARTCEDRPEPERERIIARACKPHRTEETAAIRRLAQTLDAQTRRQLFDETLDPHMMPDSLAKAVPHNLESLILN